MTFSLHPGAEQDITDALDFYSTQAGTVVSNRFLDEVERVAHLLVEHPSLGTSISKGRRVFSLNIFPYSVVYQNLENGVLILIVRHHHRKPGYAGSRR